MIHYYKYNQGTIFFMLLHRHEAKRASLLLHASWQILCDSGVS